MTDQLDRRIRQLVQEIGDAAPPPTEWPGNSNLRTMPQPTRESRRPILVGLAIAAALAAVVGGGVLLANRPTTQRLAGTPDSTQDLQDPQISAEPTAPLPATASLTALSPESWAVPTVVPTGMTFQGALANGDRSRSYNYLDPATGTSFSVRMTSVGPPALQTADTINIGGDNWLVSTPEEASATIMIERTINGIGLLLATHGLDLDTTTAIAAGLRTGDAAFFPRSPLDIGDPNNFTVVAETSTTGGQVTLGAVSDGVQYCFSIANSGDCQGTFDGTPISKPQALLRSDSADSLVYGMIAADVASIEIHFTDGQIITTAPQDTSDSFAINFFLISVAGGDTMTIDHAVALDIAGQQLGQASP